MELRNRVLFIFVLSLIRGHSGQVRNYGVSDLPHSQHAGAKTLQSTNSTDDKFFFHKEPSPDDIHYYLWTNGNGIDDPREIEEMSTDALMAAGYNPSNPSIIISHGFSSDGIGHGARFAEAYMEAGEYNVFSIDWGKLASWTNYFGAVSHTRFVGEESVKLVTLLHNNGGTQNLHMVGHSLGAHVVGFIGKKFQEAGYGKIPKITGLDPALPGFELALEWARLDQNDAEFVQVIHTNSGPLWEGCLSFSKRLGHMDFYPAGGSHQPGCTDICLGEVCNENDLNDLVKGGCSHDRANQYFVESILNKDNFVAWECADWESFEAGQCCPRDDAVMGEFAQKKDIGEYFLMVGTESPFGQSGDGHFC